MICRYDPGSPCKSEEEWDSREAMMLPGNSLSRVSNIAAAGDGRWELTPDFAKAYRDDIAENPRGLSDLALVQELAKTMDWDEVTSLADEQGQDPVVCFYVVPDGYVANEEFLFTARIKQ